MIWFDEDIKLYKNITEQLTQVAQVIQLSIIIPSALTCFGISLIVISLLFGINEKYKKTNKACSKNENEIALIDKKKQNKSVTSKEIDDQVVPLT